MDFYSAEYWDWFSFEDYATKKPIESVALSPQITTARTVGPFQYAGDE